VTGSEIVARLDNYLLFLIFFEQIFSIAGTIKKLFKNKKIVLEQI